MKRHRWNNGRMNGPVAVLATLRTACLGAELFALSRDHSLHAQGDGIA
jgi:hypothetical protein